MITFERFNYAYPDSPEPVLRDLGLQIHPGEFVLVVGPSGAGKSTFLRAINGLVPHFHGGQVSGRVRVGGKDPVAEGPRGMAETVGVVFQDPEASFVVDTVEDELTFALENFGFAPAVMRKRIEEVLDQLKIAGLRDRSIGTLSGGEKQRVALAAALALHPSVLVLDEPTSQLDPQAAEEVLVAVRQLNEDLGLTVLCAEHRLERVVQYCDRILYFPGPGQQALLGAPDEVLSQIELTPPLITLGKALGWQPLPLTIKEGRRELQRVVVGQRMCHVSGVTCQVSRVGCQVPGDAHCASPAITVRDLWHAYGGREALCGVNLDVRAGELLAVMGRNGSGKTTLLKHLAALLQPQQGKVMVAGVDTRRGLEAIVPHVGYVPQHPGALLFAETVREELAFTRRSRGLAPDPDADDHLLARLGLAALAGVYPRDLSGGEAQRAALAAVLVAEPGVLLLDEPTRGLDYGAKAALARILRSQCEAGRAVMLVTHDVELVASAADRVVLLAEGQVVVDGSVREVMTGSLVFTTQIHKLFRDSRFLTVDDAVAHLQPAVEGGAV